MDDALENAYSTHFKEIENSVSEVEKKLCKLSQEKFKTFLGDSTENRKVSKPNSSTRKNHVKKVIEEIKTDVKYNFEKEFSSHKSMYFQYWRMSNPNMTDTQCSELYQNMLSNVLPDETKKIFYAFLTGEAGDTESVLYQYIQTKMKYFVWDIVVHNFRYFGCLFEQNAFTNIDGNQKSPPVGKLELPAELTKPLSLSSIPKFDKEIDSGPALWQIKNLLSSILEPIMIPVTIPDLRSVRTWRGNNVRIMNYVVTVVLYGRYIDHPDFPPALKTITNNGPVFPPPWWVVVKFFKSCGLPDNKSTKNQESETIFMKKELSEAMQECYVDMHIQALSYISGLWNSMEVQRRVLSKKESSVASESSYKLVPFNCTVTSNTKRPPLFNDPTDWVYRYRHQHLIGSYDEFRFTNKDPVEPQELDYLKSIAEDGLHYKEIAIMETVLKSDIHNKRPLPQGKK